MISAGARPLVKEQVMRSWYRRVGLLACGAVVLMFLAGCSKHEHRKVRVHEEQRAGEVQETPPGDEMIVE